MISFLVPVYNRDVRSLVNEIFDQCRKLNIEFEILVYDDHSKQKYKEKNKELAFKTGVAYLELSKNLGRSKIRNWLVKNSRYNNIVFLDCDQYIRLEDHDIDPQTYKADIQVSSNGSVLNNDLIRFEAGDNILLEPGFEVQLGATFIAEIIGCP